MPSNPPSRSSSPKPYPLDSNYKFQSPEFKNFVQTQIENEIVATFEGRAYNPKLVPSWTNEANKRLVDRLAKLTTNYKFMVTTVLQETSTTTKKPLSSVCQLAASWGEETDGVCVVEWGNDEWTVGVTVWGVLI